MLKHTEEKRRTRTNLEWARVRQTTGVASPEEALRWEVEITSLRKTTMDIQSQMNQALLALKQILRIPMKPGELCGCAGPGQHGVRHRQERAQLL